MNWLEFVTTNWDKIVFSVTSIAGVTGWLRERGKRMRDNRDRDVAFWEKTIKAQDLIIDRQNERIAKLELRYEGRIKELERMNQDQKKQIDSMQEEIKDLTERLERHEPVKKSAKRNNNHETTA